MVVAHVLVVLGCGLLLAGLLESEGHGDSVYAGTPYTLAGYVGCVATRLLGMAQPLLKRALSECVRVTDDILTGGILSLASGLEDAVVVDNLDGALGARARIVNLHLEFVLLTLLLLAHQRGCCLDARCLAGPNHAHG